MLHPRPYVPCLYKHADLLWAIFGLLQQCPITFSFCYIAGHQDDFTQFKDLPLLAQLNIQVDTLAKQALQVLGHQATPPLLLPLLGLHWELLIKSLPVSSYPCTTILDHLSFNLGISHWIRKGQLSSQMAALVNWSLLEFALKPCSPTFWMWLSKFASSHSAVSKMMALWKRWESPLLSTLSFIGRNHVPCHPMPQWSLHFSLAPIAGGVLLMAHQSQHASCITHGLLVTLHGQGQTSFALAAPPSCRSAANQQDLISFFGFTLGQLSSSWETTQAQFWFKKQVLKLLTHWA